MAITIPTYDAVVASVLAFYRNRFPGRDLGTESYLGKQARAEAMLFFMFMQSVVSADSDATPTSKSSSAALDQWGIAVGIPSGTAGVYGRKSATAATGITGTVTGTSAVTVTTGALLTASDGVTTFKLNGSVTTSGAAPGTGTVAGTFDAVTTGTVGNLAVASVLTWQSPPAGIDATVKTTAIAATLGIDVESDQSVLARIQQKLQTPSKGGTSADYRAWAESVSGIKRAYPYPLRGGLGTVHVLITGAGSGTARDPGAGTATTGKTGVDNYINGTSTTGGQRTVTSQGYLTLRPYMPAYGTGPASTGGLLVRARLTPRAKYVFDWDDTAFASYTVGAYSAGVGGAADTLTLSPSCPASLSTSAAAGNKPRIQVLVSTTGGPAVPLQCQVTSVSGAVLTLQNPLPTGWVVPTVNDKVYAGGPAVTVTGNAILAYIDGLGPSRKVGYYADAVDVWEDTASIARITQICLDQKDTDGTPYFLNVSAGSLSVSIANGTNSAAYTDVQAADGLGNNPELLYAKWVAVTQ